MDNIVIPDEYQWLRVEKFLLYDHGDDKSNRFFIFSTQVELDRFILAETFLGEGTFKVPPDMYQVYIIHAELFNGFWPFIFILMPNKQKATYAEVFLKLLELFDVSWC